MPPTAGRGSISAFAADLRRRTPHAAHLHLPFEPRRRASRADEGMARKPGVREYITTGIPPGRRLGEDAQSSPFDCDDYLISTRATRSTPLSAITRFPSRSVIML